MNKVAKSALAGAAALVLLAGPAVAETYTAWCVISDGELNIRRHNWVGSDRIGYLCNGWSIEVDQVTSNGWARVIGGDEWDFGFCKVEYLTSKPDGSGRWHNNTGGRVRIRATMGGKTAGWLSSVDSVNVLSWAKDNEGTDWAYTKQGWILGDCLTKE